MDVYEALYTTRAMRRVKLDPIPEAVQKKILDAAIRAPSGGNQQNWRFLLVDSPEVKAKIAPLYQKCLGNLWTTFYAPMVAAAAADPDNPDSKQFVRVRNSAPVILALSTATKRLSTLLPFFSRSLIAASKPS